MATKLRRFCAIGAGWMACVRCGTGADAAQIIGAPARVRPIPTEMDAGGRIRAEGSPVDRTALVGTVILADEALYGAKHVLQKD